MVHEELLRIVITTKDEGWKQSLFAYLANELSQKQGSIRRLRAVQTCADYLLVNPEPMVDGEGHPIDPHPGLIVIRNLLTDILCPPNDPIQVEARVEERMYAASALGGLGLESLDRFAHVLGEEHVNEELLRVVCAAGLRLCMQFQERDASASIDLYQKLDQARLSNYAVALWNTVKSLRTDHSGSFEWGVGVFRLSQEERTHMHFVERAGAQFEWFAAARLKLQANNKLLPWADLTDDLSQHLNRLQGWIDRLIQGEDWIAPPSEIQTFLAEVRGPWSGVDRFTRYWNLPLFDPWQSRRDFQRVENVMNTYTNTWDLNEKIGQGQVKNKVSDRLKPVSSLVFGPLESKVNGWGLAASWSGAKRVKMSENSANPSTTPSDWALELDRPRATGLTFESAIPKGAHAATLNFIHCSPSRIPLPYQGATEVEIAIADAGYKLDLLVQNPAFEPLRFSIPNRILEGRESLEITVKLVGSRSLYWLLGIWVEFDVE